MDENELKLEQSKLATFAFQSYLSAVSSSNSGFGPASILNHIKPIIGVDAFFNDEHDFPSDGSNPINTNAASKFVHLELKFDQEIDGKVEYYFHIESTRDKHSKKGPKRKLNKVKKDKWSNSFKADTGDQVLITVVMIGLVDFGFWEIYDDVEFFTKTVIVP